MNLSINKLYILFALFFSVSLSMESFAQWNDWKDTKSVIYNMRKAQRERKIYFSQFHLWDITGQNIHTSKFHDQTGEVLYVYSLDFYYTSGSYFADDYQAKCRANTIEVVKKQWRENKAIPCFSWHLENPYVPSGYEFMGCRYRFGDTKANYPDEHKNVVKEIISGKGGERCGNGRYRGSETKSWKNPKKWFDDCCREVASIVREFVDDNGKPIPIIFRPWHECEDSWMWWGRTSTTPEDYKKLFVLTEKKIKKYAKKSQILWAYSPDSYWKTEEEFMLRYPGDKYVDFIGYDDYQLGYPMKLDAEIAKARIVSRVAEQHNKVSALFEGANSIESTSDVYFKNYLMPLLLGNYSAPPFKHSPKRE